MAKKLPVRPIDTAIASRIRELHKKYPALGHDGIGKLLLGEGINVDSAHLRAFLKNKNMKVAPTGKWENNADPLAGFGAGLVKKGKGGGFG